MEKPTRKFVPSDRLIEIAEEFAQRVRDGDSPTIDEYVAGHPDVEDEIRRYLPMLETASRTHAYSATDTTHDLPLTPEQLPLGLSRYHVKGLIGRGNMGAVYLAHDLELDRVVGLKLPQFTRGQTVERFYREARAMATIDHPNICAVYDVGEIGPSDIDSDELNGLVGRPYMTMAYIEGNSLSDLQSQPWSARDAAQLIRKVASALQAAHDAGVVHRDVKPSNIIIDRAGEPIVTDFGLARRDLPDELDITVEGQIIGSPAYMSPEQINGDPDIGPSADVYSLGVMLYELVCGHRPFSGSPLTLLRDICWKEAPSPKSFRDTLDTDIVSICLKAIRKDPAQRYSSAADFAGDLDAYLAGHGIQASQRKRRSAVLMVGLPVLLAIGAVITRNYWFPAVPAEISHTVSVSAKRLTPTISLDEFQRQLNRILYEHFKFRSRDARKPDVSARYAQIFAEFGIDPEFTSANQMTRFLQSLPEDVRNDVLIGLESWLLCSFRNTEDVPVPWLLASLEANDSDSDKHRLRKSLREMNCNSIPVFLKQFQIKHYDPRMSAIWSLYLQGLIRSFDKQAEEKKLIRKLDLEFLTATHKVFPEDSAVNVAFGLRKKYNRNHVGAIPHFEKANEVEASAAVCSHLGMSYLATKQYDKAADVLKQAIELDDDYPTSHALLGRAYFFTGDLENAEREIIWALEKGAGFQGQSYRFLAKIHLSRGDEEAATDAAMKAIANFRSQGRHRQIVGITQEMLRQLATRPGRGSVDCRFKLVTSLFRASKQLDQFKNVRPHIGRLIRDLEDREAQDEEKIDQLKEMVSFLVKRSRPRAARS